MQIATCTTKKFLCFYCQVAEHSGKELVCKAYMYRGTEKRRVREKRRTEMSSGVKGEKEETNRKNLI